MRGVVFFMDTIKESLQTIGKIINVESIMTKKQMEDLLKAVLSLLLEFKKDNESLNTETKKEVDNLINKVEKIINSYQSKLESELQNIKLEFDSKTTKLISDCVNLIAECKACMPKDGEPGKDADEEKIVEDVLAKIKLPEYEKFILDGKGGQIVDEINALDLSEENKIDAKHIKNLPKSTNSGNMAFVNRGQVLVQDLSPQLDGVTKTFLLPLFRNVVMVTSTSFPFTFRPTIDYTVSGSNITFTSEVVASTTLQSGQTLLVLYIGL